MNLGVKTVLIITSTVVLGLVGIFWIAGDVLIEDYKQLEAAGAEQDARRVHDAIQADLTDIAVSAQEVADVAAVVFAGAGGNGSTDENESLQVFFSLFVANDIDSAFVRFGDPPQAFGVAFDAATFAFTDLPAALNETLQQSVVVARGGAGGGPDSGIVTTEAGAYLVGAYRLAFPDAMLESLPPEQRGPVVVALVRTMDAAYVASLGERMGEELQLVLWDEDDPAAAGLADTAPGEVALDRPDWDHMTIRFRMDDEQGRPALAMAIEQDRALFQQGIDSITFFFVASLAIAAALLVVGILLIRFMVTDRVRHLDESIQQIRGGHDLHARADVGGRDEVTHLAEDFNDLMDALEGRTQALVKSNDDLQSFARVVTHDLKSPLSTFALNLRLLRTQAEVDGDDKEKQRITRMENQVGKMAERIDAILAYSRSRQADATMGAVDLNPVVAGVLDDLAAEIGTSGAEIRIDDLPTVRGDAGQLAQVFQNLLSNAIKFAAPGEAPHVRVWSASGRTGWAVHVDDRGVGFLPEDVEQMFKPFSRLKNATGRAGHGVGLASCASILERHGGRLHAQGFPGKGARFTVLLRRVEEVPEGTSAAADAPPAPTGAAPATAGT